MAVCGIGRFIKCGIRKTRPEKIRPEQFVPEKIRPGQIRPHIPNLSNLLSSHPEPKKDNQNTIHSKLSQKHRNCIFDLAYRFVSSGTAVFDLSIDVVINYELESGTKDYEQESGTK